MKKYGIKGIFFIPNNTRMNAGEIKQLHAQGFGIGGHTVSHPENLHFLPAEDIRREVEYNKLWLEDIIGEKIRHFCYPGGRFDGRVVETVKALGYATARTTLVGNTELPGDPYRTATTVHILPTRREYAGQNWVEYAKAKFNEARGRGAEGYFHAWGHGWEVTAYNQWKQLEELLKYINLCQNS